MADEYRGSLITACGVTHTVPLYETLPSGTPILRYQLKTENPTGKTASIPVVAYGDMAKAEARVLKQGSRIYVVGTLQTREIQGKPVTELVPQQTTYLGQVNWPNGARDQRILPADPLQRYGVQAALIGDIVDDPTFTLLGEEKTPFIKFALRCANPKGHPANVTVVHFGFLAATYHAKLRKGMRVLVNAEARSHYYFPPAQPRRPIYVLQFVTENVEILGVPAGLPAPASTLALPAGAKA